jgi:hypothetical protein
LGKYALSADSDSIFQYAGEKRRSILGAVRPASRFCFEEFQAIAPRIFGEESLRVRQRIVFGDFYCVSEKRFAELGEIVDGEGGMGLFCGPKFGLYADVELLIAALEPAAAPCAKRGRLFDFRQS